MNGGTYGLLARWITVALAALALAYGYGALNTRVATLEVRALDYRSLVVQLTDVSARLISLEREIERVRMTLERDLRVVPGPSPQRVQPRS